ncbi:hypothetical protein ACFQ22_01545 [Lentilactobacillus raoultii]|uniref:XRE family transcriptional regulator n=1 Tax=Lentilactobacillus raoultii TaxID=1987503 RepID=A0ABW3PFK9_9LACO|nr:hypothetical protein [Lentilactobacillus raoultii]
MMIMPSLGISRFVDSYCRQRKVLQNSVVGVGIDRKKIANILQGQPIRLKTISDRIGLSKSRYYRWVNYDIDLPLEYVMGIKKMLGMSNQELLDVLLPTTDEIISTFSMAAYYSWADDKDGHLDTIIASLKKYDDEDTYFDSPFFYTVTYLKAVLSVKQNISPNSFITAIDDYLASVETMTSYDIFLKLAITQLKLSVNASHPLRGIEIYCAKLLDKLKSANLIDANVWLGFIIDVLMDLHLNQQDRVALTLLDKVYAGLSSGDGLDKYSEALLMGVLDLLKDCGSGTNGHQKALEILERLGGYRSIFKSDSLYWNTFEKYLVTANDVDKG